MRKNRVREKCCFHQREERGKNAHHAADVLHKEKEEKKSRGEQVRQRKTVHLDSRKKEKTT